MLNNKWIGAMGSVNLLLERRSDDLESKPNPDNPKLSASRSQNGFGLGYSKAIGRNSIQLNSRNDNYDNFGVVNTNAIGYGFQLGNAWSISASSSSGFRAPTLEQQYGPYGAQNLKPESSNSQEIGLKYSFDKTIFKVALFESKYTNLISSSQTLTSCSAGFFCYFNVGKANIKGTSLQGQHSFAGFDISASLDDLVPVNEDSGKDLNLRARRTAKWLCPNDCKDGFLNWKISS